MCQRHDISSRTAAAFIEMLAACECTFLSFFGMMSSNNMDILQLHNTAEQFWELPLK